MRNLKFVLALYVAVAMIAAPALAVMKTTGIVGPGGESVANTTITVFNAQGEKVGEGKSDDKGVFAFDYPDKGTYTLKYTGGELTVTVAGAGLSTTALAAGAGGLGLLAVAGSGSSGSGSGGTTDTGTDTDTNGETKTCADPSSIAGSYTGLGTLTDQMGFSYSPSFNISNSMTTDGDFVTVKSSADVKGVVTPGCSYSGTGIYMSGDTTVTETYNGLFMYNSATGKWGFDGTLGFSRPNGDYANFNVDLNQQ